MRESGEDELRTGYKILIYIKLLIYSISVIKNVCAESETIREFVIIWNFVNGYSQNNKINLKDKHFRSQL